MGLLFDKNNVLLDPFAKAVTGQRNWGERPESDEGFVYHARVVENNFDWGKMTFPEIPAEDLIIYETHVRGFTKDASSGVTAGGTYVRGTAPEDSVPEGSGRQRDRASPDF